MTDKELRFYSKIASTYHRNVPYSRAWLKPYDIAIEVIIFLTESKLELNKDNFCEHLPFIHNKLHFAEKKAKPNIYEHHKDQMIKHTKEHREENKKSVNKYRLKIKAQKEEASIDSTKITTT